MKNLKIKKQQLKKLLGKNFNHTIITLISRVNEDNGYEKKGEIQSFNQHYLSHLFETLERPNENPFGLKGFGGGYIDGFEIPFEDYEIELDRRWIWENKSKVELDEIEKQISKILECKIHQRLYLVDNV